MSNVDKVCITVYTKVKPTSNDIPYLVYLKKPSSERTNYNKQRYSFFCQSVNLWKDKGRQLTSDQSKYVQLISILSECFNISFSVSIY